MPKMYWDYGPLEAGDILRVDIEGDTLRLYRNGELVFTKENFQHDRKTQIDVMDCFKKLVEF